MVGLDLPLFDCACAAPWHTPAILLRRDTANAEEIAGVFVKDAACVDMVLEIGGDGGPHAFTTGDETLIAFQPNVRIFGVAVRARNFGAKDRIRGCIEDGVQVVKCRMEDGGDVQFVCEAYCERCRSKVSFKKSTGPISFASKPNRGVANNGGTHGTHLDPDSVTRRSLKSTRPG